MSIPVERRAALSTWLPAIGASLLVFLLFQPALLFTRTTPAGYDLAGHVYPLYVAVHELIPRGRIHAWDGGWFGGFPLYWFYFPLPAFIAAALTPLVGFLPAVKLTSVLGALTLPLGIAWLVRELRLSALTSACVVLVGSSFLLIGSYSFFGANLESTLVGEFAYALGFTLALAYCASLVRARRLGTTRYVLPALLLAATALAHVVVTIGAVLASIALLRDARGRAVVLGSWVLGFLLAAFWAVPFLVRLEPIDLYAHFPTTLGAPLPLEMLPLLPLAAFGVRSAFRHARPLLWLTIPAVAGFVLYWFPLGPVHQGRMLPFWFLALHLLAGVALGDALAAALRTPRRRASIAVALAAAALTAAPFALREERELAAWARYNYSGIESKESWPEVDALMDALRSQPPGRVYWNDDAAAFAAHGSRHLFALIPYWAPDHSAMRGLWVESSRLTPELDTIDAILRVGATAPANGAPHPAWTEAARRMGLLGVEYFIASGDPARDAMHSLVGAPIHEGGAFTLFRLPSVSLVESSRGQGLARVVEVTGTRIEIETRAAGTPHIVRVPEFASWQVDGGVGPVEIAPGFMGIVPTATRATLTFRATWAEWTGTALSLLGLVAVVALFVRTRWNRTQRIVVDPIV